MRQKVRDWKDLPEEQNDPETLEEELEEPAALTPEERLIAEIDKALVNLSGKISSEGLKVADLVKLLQVRRELSADRPKYSSIRWVRECDEQTPSKS